MKKLKTAALLSSLAILSSMGTVHAGTAQANLTVQATVEESCKIEVVSNVDFGIYVPDADKLAQGTLRVTCIKNVAPIVSLLGGGAQAGDRILSNGPDSIAYTLYQPTDNALACDAANLVTTWGIDAKSLLLNAFTGYVPQEYSVCGKIAAGQITVGAGTYNDVVTAQVDY
jgi:spore coat protein U-like protein